MQKKIAEEVREMLEKQIKGFEKEILLEKFLVRLKMEYPTLILYANHVSINADRKRGVDFVIGYKPIGKENVFTIEFNLKSSQAFLERHIQRYPKISTYVLRVDDLNDYARMKNIFFRFLDEAIEGVTHWE
ncbi:MAG: hypothetical protein AAB681_01735 [Patescibacteria group bacterium]